LRDGLEEKREAGAEIGGGKRATGAGSGQGGRGLAGESSLGWLRRERGRDEWKRLLSRTGLGESERQRRKCERDFSVLTESPRKTPQEASTLFLSSGLF
jgi:hypothetical protein